jgi:hypothetical protein
VIIYEEQFPTLGVHIELSTEGSEGAPQKFTVNLKRGGKTLVTWGCDQYQAREFYSGVRSTMQILEALEELKRGAH